MYEPRLSARGVLTSTMPQTAKESARVAARCMWCSFACARSGELLEHFRSSHPNEYCASEERFKMAMRDKVVGKSDPAAADAAAGAAQLFGGGRGSGSGFFAPDCDKAAAAVATASADCGSSKTTTFGGGGGSACPHCHIDCLTRKKLMSHIEAAHKATEDDDDDVDDDGEPPVKVIRLKRSGGGDLIESLSAAGVERISPALGQLLKAMRPGDAGAATPHAAASMPAAGGTAVKARGGGGGAAGPSVGGSVPLPAQQLPNGGCGGGGGAAKGGGGCGLMGDLRVLTLASGSIARVADKKYKCFWCNALFRKRGKLMDHIDLFHKDSKQQTEVEAEMLNSAAAAVARKDAAAAPSSAADGKCAAADVPQQPPPRTSTALHGEAEGDCHAPSSIRRGAATAATQQRLQAAVAPARVPPCRFVYRAPVHRLKREDAAAAAADDDEAPEDARSGCKFYFGKSTNPLAVGRPPVLTGAAAAVGGCPKTVAMQWPASSYPPTCYFYAGGGSGGASAPLHPQYKPASAAAQPALEVPYLLLCGGGGGGRPTMPYHEEDGGGRSRLPIVPMAAEAALLSQRYAAAAAAAARYRAAEEHPLDLSSRLR